MQPDGRRLVHGNRECERREGLWDGESASGFCVQVEPQVLRAAPEGAAAKHITESTCVVELVRILSDGVLDTFVINIALKLCFTGNHIIHNDHSVGVYKTIIYIVSNDRGERIRHNVLYLLLVLKRFAAPNTVIGKGLASRAEDGASR